jgi:uncharacterized membrane protein YfhO
MRKLKASESASIIAAITFMLSGYLLSVHNLLSILLSVTWVPLLLLLYFAAFVKKNIKYSIFAAMVASVMFFAGGVIMLYGTLLIILFLTAFPYLFFMKEECPSIKVRFFYLGTFLALFLGISAIQLLPFLELSHLSTRADGFTYAKATTWSLHPRDFLQFFIPDLFGYELKPNEYWQNQSWLMSLYIGIIPFLLSVFFFIKKGKRQLCLALLIIISLILALGKYTPLYALFFHYVPFMGKVRYPVRFLFITIFVISICAGFGYDCLKEKIKKGDNTVKNLIYGISILALSGVLIMGLFDFFEGQVSHLMKIKGFCPPVYNDISINIHNVKRLLAIFIIFSLILWTFTRVKVNNSLLSLGVISLLTFDLFFGNFGFYDRTPAKDYHKNSSNIDFILSDKSLFRIFVTPLTMKAKYISTFSESSPFNKLTVDKEKILPGYGLERGIFDSCAWGVLVEKRINNIYKLIRTAPKVDSTNLLDIMNVKYVISIPEIKSPKFKSVLANPLISNKGKEVINKEKTIKIYQNLDYFPRAFLVPKYRVLKSEQEFKDILSSKEFNPMDVVLLEEEPDDMNYKRGDSPYKEIVEKVEIQEYRNNSISLHVSLPEPKFLFMSEMYYPGWNAYVDGRRKKIYRANHAFRAVFLEPGVHKIEFVYRPWTFRLGMTISTATIIGLMVFGYMRRGT